MGAGLGSREREPGAARASLFAGYRELIARGVGPRVYWRVTPWWLKVTLVFVVTRVLTSVILMLFAENQGSTYFASSHPSLVDYSNIWDGFWYNRIGFGGYPKVLPVDGDRHVQQNEWAFLPAFPSIVRVVYTLGLSWNLAAVVVATLAGFGAVIVFYRVLIRFIAPDRALFAVVVFCVAPASPVLQIGYAESLGLLWLAIALLLLVDRSYWLLIPVLTVWAFTRPGAVAFGLALGLHWIYRWWCRRSDPFPISQRVVLIVVGLWSAVVGFAWPIIAGFATNDPHAYFDTELAWRRGYPGISPELALFTPWLQGAVFWFNWALRLPIWVAVVVLVVLVVGFAALLFSKPARALGPDLRMWSASYAVYLLAVFFPQSSTIRLLAPMFPLAGVVAYPRSYWYRWGVVLVSIVLQIMWIWQCWYVGSDDWTPP